MHGLPQFETELDVKRREQNAYKYLCYLEEARNWVSEYLKDQSLTEATQFEHQLRDGVILAKVSNYFDPILTPESKIFDIDQNFYHNNRGLHYRHTDNINHYFRFLSKIGLPSVFYPETTDIYDMKNMPKCIFCLHALSYFLHKKGLAKPIHSIYGVAEFSKEQLNAVERSLEKYKIDLPNFARISGILAEEMSDDDAEMHAAIIAINEAFDRNAGLFEIQELLINPHAQLKHVFSDNIEAYYEDIRRTKQEKNNSNKATCDDIYSLYLTRNEIQARLDFINVVNLMNDITEHVQNNNVKELIDALCNPIAGVTSLISDLGVFYMDFLKNVCENNDGFIPSLKEVYEAIAMGNTKFEHILALGADILRINNLIEEPIGDPSAEVNFILKKHFKTYVDNCSYYDQLVAYKKTKNSTRPQKWLKINLVGDNSSGIYINTQNSCDWTLEEPEDYSDSNLLSVHDIMNIISNVNSVYTRELYYLANEPSVVILQSALRHLLQRRRYEDHMEYMSSVTKHILILQRAIRGYLSITSLRKYRKYLCIDDGSVTIMESYMKMIILRIPFERRMQYFLDNIDHITKIQAVFRGNRAKKKFNALLYDDHPPFSVVQEFIHLLDMREQDYIEESELQNLRMEIIVMMNYNQKLQGKIDTLDTEVGLLIRNKIIIMNDQQKKLRLNKLKNQKIPSCFTVPEKEMTELLDVMGKIVYILQTNPCYFYRLIKQHQYNRSRSSKLKNLILVCFNYGTHKRDEYLLTKFVSYSIENEIRELGEGGIEAVLGTDNFILDITVQILRSIRYSDYRVKDFIESLLTPILDNHVLRIKTDPILIYKNSVFQKEAEEGVLSGLAYNVSVEEALQYGNVKDLMISSYKRLIQAVVQILKALFDKIDIIPYGVRYLAKLFNTLLREVRPAFSENRIFAALSNIVYFRYLNMAIVVPESFGAFTSSIETIITNDQRYNLAELGRLIQILGNGGGPKDVFGGCQIPCLESFFDEWRPQFRKYMESVCDVDHLETHFKFDEFMDARLLSSPQITISAHNLIELYNVVEEIKSNKLVALIREVGVVNELRLVGSDYDAERLYNTEYVLTLRNPMDWLNDGQTKQQGLFIKCKIMLCKIMCCQSGNSVEEIMRVPATEKQEKLHQILCHKQKDLPDNKASVFFNMAGSLTLEELKREVEKDTVTLVDDGFIKPEIGYQAYINDIISDIRNKRKYATVRRREIGHLKLTLKDLEGKKKFKIEQLEYYNKYIQAILDSQPKKQKKSSLFSKQKKHVKLKYSGNKLIDKGILLSVSGVSEKDYKKLQITIEEGEERGNFVVIPHFLGIAMNSTSFTFQSLLELQRGGIGTVSFDRATCNVNLLIHLINKKFYSI